MIRKMFRQVGVIILASVLLLSACGKDDERCLIEAAKTGRIAMVRTLVHEGVDVEYRDEFDSTALMWAARLGHNEVVKELIRVGADIHTRSDRKEIIFEPMFFYPADNDHLWLDWPLKAVLENLKQHVKTYGSQTNQIYTDNDRALVETTYDSHCPMSKPDMNDDLFLHIGPIYWDRRATPLIWAARMGHPDVVKTLIDAGADVDARTKLDNTPLLDAAKTGNLIPSRTIVYCIRTMINESDDDYSERVAWIVNARQQSEEVVRLLLSAGADPNFSNYQRIAPLMNAAFNGKNNVIRQLVEYGADVQAECEWGYTALMMAAYSGQINCVRSLIDAGVDLNTMDQCGCSALALAVSMNKTEIIHLLLQAGADPDALIRSGETPLYLAITDYLNVYDGENTDDQLHTIRLLLSYGADPNANLDDGSTILQSVLNDRPYFFSHDGEPRFLNSSYCGEDCEWFWTSLAGPEVIARILVQHGAEGGRHPNPYGKHYTEDLIQKVQEKDISSVISMVKTYTRCESEQKAAEATLLWAAREGRRAVIPGLIRTGVDLEAVDVLAQTALMWAAYGGDVLTTRLLLQNGAEPNAKNHWNETALQLAVREGHAVVAKTLLRAGADPDARNCYDETTLMLAVFSGDIEITELLLENGADIEQRSRQLTPLMLAVRKGDVKMVRLLLAAGADANVKDHCGKTAESYNWDTSAHKDEISKLLIDAGFPGDR